MSEFNKKYRARFEKLSTTNVSDALDALGLKGSTYGVTSLIPSLCKILGPAVTVKVAPAGEVKNKVHMCVTAVNVAEEGDVIVIDNGGRLDISCWGGIMANTAKVKGVNGVAIDGAARDIDDCVAANFPVYARGSVVATARGRAMEESTNKMIQFAGVQVSPGDIVMGDRSGIVIVPSAKIEEVLVKAEELFEKEEKMVAEILSGASGVDVDQKYGYENMLK
ncbi:RraA family protein [Intestinibacter sp.]|uniref:RraA family protein n=1 Tax=Intestinibacter sp. TaxID=1965304 RepID=UPI003F1761B1